MLHQIPPPPVPQAPPHPLVLLLPPHHPPIQQQMRISKHPRIHQPRRLRAEEPLVRAQELRQRGESGIARPVQGVGIDDGGAAGFDELLEGGGAEGAGEGEAGGRRSGGGGDVEGAGDGGEVAGREVEGVEPGVADAVVEEGDVGGLVAWRVGWLLGFIFVGGVAGGFGGPFLELGGRDGSACGGSGGVWVGGRGGGEEEGEGTGGGGVVAGGLGGEGDAGEEEVGLVVMSVVRLRVGSWERTCHFRQLGLNDGEPLRASSSRAKM